MFRVARHPPSGWEGILLQSQLTDVETKPLSHSVITCLRDRCAMYQQFRPLTGAVIFFLLLSPLDSGTQQNPDRLEPMDVFRVQVASDPQISPDGNHIVYVRQSAH